MIFSFHRHNKRQFQLNSNSLQSSYARLYHTAVPQAMSRNTNIPRPVSDDIPEYCYTRSNNNDILASSHIPYVSPPYCTQLQFHRNSLWQIAVHWAAVNWTVQTAVPVQTEYSDTKRQFTSHFYSLQNRTAFDVMDLYFSASNAK
jgi:hypothetical protein